MERNDPTLKRINMRRFLDEIRAHGPSSRGHLARVTGVSAPTSSKVISELGETGLLEEVEEAEATGGRPSRLYRLATTTAYLVAAVVGERQCHVLTGDLSGTLHHGDERFFETPATYETLVDRLAEAIDAVRERRAGRCLGVGLCLPGLVDEAKGEVVFSPNVHILDKRPVGGDLSHRLDVEIVCTQTQRGMCLAEQAFGQARGLRDFVVLDVGSGLSAGVVSGGHYVGGQNGFAGELGHVTVEPDGPLCGCGNRGCLQTLATDAAFAEAVSARVGAPLSVEEIVELAQSDRLDVGEELRRTLDYLSIAVAGAINLFNPAAVYISASIFDVDDAAFVSMVGGVRRRALRPSTDRCAIVRAQSDKPLGALATLLETLFSSVGPRLP